MTIALLCGIFPTGAVYAQEDFAPIVSEEAAALGAMELLCGETISADANAYMTRAEFVANLFKIAGYTAVEYGGADTPFVDVNAMATHFNEICFFYGAGLLQGNGEGMFYPDEPITYAAAVKLAVLVTGYEKYTGARYGTDFPSAYVAAAQRLKLDKGLKISGTDKELSNDNAVKLLYNIARTPVLRDDDFSTTGEIIFEKDEDRELLGERNNIFYDEGTVTNNGIVSIKTGERTAPYAEVGGKKVLLKDDDLLHDLLGERVKYFYKTDNGESTLLYAARKDGAATVTEIESGDLLPDDAEYGKTRIVYTENNRRCTIDISAEADIIYNDTAHNVYSVLKPAQGKIKLIDYDGDGAADAVIVREFDNMYVKAVPSTGDRILGKYNKALYTDDYTHVKIYDGDEEITLGELRTGGVISYVESLDKEYLFIWENAPAKTDALTAVGEKNGRDAYTFSGAEYVFAESLRQTAADGTYFVTVPTIGHSYKFCTDMQGNIADIEDTADARLQYAFLIKAASDDKPLSKGDTALVKLMTTSGEILTAKTARKITLNGDKGKTGADLLALVSREEVVRVTLNDDGEITEFEFAADNTAHDYGYDTTRFTKDFSRDTTATFYSNSVNMFNLKYFVTKTTVCFAKYLDLDEENPYGLKSASGFSNGAHPVVELYDANEKHEVAAMAAFVNVTGASDALMLVDKVRYVTRDTGNVKQISGVREGKYVTYTERFEGAITDDIKRGDVIRLAVHQDTLTGIELIKRLRDTSDKTPFLYDSSGSATSYKGSGTLFGEIYARGDNNITTLNPTGHPNGRLTSSSFSMLMYSAVYVAVYDAVNDTVSVGDMRDFNQISVPDKNGDLKANDRNVMVLLRNDQDHIKDAVIVYY